MLSIRDTEVKGGRSLLSAWRELLAEGIIPFWMKALDREYGGVFSCMAEAGTVLSTEKYTWSQARMAWTLAALYRRFEGRAEFSVTTVLK